MRGNDGKNMMPINPEEYDALAKAARNAEYLSILDRSMAQPENGDVVIRTMDELEAME